MKFAGGLCLLFLGFSIVNEANSAILDNLLNTAKEVGAGVQKMGDDVLGAFMSPSRKCKNMACSNSDMLKVLEENNVPLQHMQSSYAMSAGGAVVPVSHFQGKRSVSSQDNPLSKLFKK